MHPGSVGRVDAAERMSGFSKTEIALFRQQFERLDASKSGSIGLVAATGLIDACWAAAGLRHKPHPRDVEKVFQTHQQNDKITISHFIMILQTLKNHQVRGRAQSADSTTSKWDTVKRGGVAAAKKVGRFFGVADKKVEGAPSNMEMWKFKMGERAKTGNVGVKGVDWTKLTTTLQRKRAALQTSENLPLDPLHNNKRSISAPAPEEMLESVDEEISGAIEVDVHNPPNQARAASQPVVRAATSHPNASHAAVSAPEIQPINEPARRHQQTDDTFIHDAKEAMAYYRRRVREEQEEQQKKEEWFGSSPQDMQNLLSESTIDRRDSSAGGVKKVDTMVRMQLESLPTFFPIFIILVSIAQLIAFGVTAYLGGFSPIGFGAENKTGLFSSPEPPYHVKNYSHLVPKNMWIGPDARYLIHIGAKFTPCMRTDHRIFARYAEILDREDNEGGRGCCILDLGYRVGIYVTSQKCDSYQGHFQAGLTCTKYLQTGDSVLIEFRPCCTTITGSCTLASKDLCDFYEGTFFQDKENCSEVNCLDKVCGMGGLSSDKDKPYLPSNPNQGWRFIMPLIFHTGVIHLVIVIILQVLIGWNIEKTAGWFRVFLVYVLSGVGGYLVSGIFVPYQPTVGASPSVFGLLGVLIVELFQTWQLIERKLLEVIKLSVIILVFLMVGTLPYVDNFAHIGGLAFGVVAAIIFLPYITFGKWDARRKRIILIIAVPGLIFMYIIGLVVFYVVQNPNFCPNCKYVNCIPYTSTICEDTFASPDPDNVPL